MRLDYHDMYEAQFEDLVHALCYELLGPGTQKFSKGPDGGRDARFTGTAAKFPSSTAPLSGAFIVQAKHTDSPIAKLSDSDFGLAKTSVVSKELIRIKRLVSRGELDHYLLFTNRRGGGEATVTLEERLREDGGTKTAHVVAIENLDFHVKYHAEAVAAAGLNSFLEPLRVVPDELAAVVTQLAKFLSGVQPIRMDLDRVSFKDKNEKNDLPTATADSIVRNYMKDFGAISEFLAAPANENLRSLYETAASEFHQEILERRSNGIRMDILLNQLMTRLRTRDGDIARNPRLSRALLYYMYYICDIGETT